MRGGQLVGNVKANLNGLNKLLKSLKEDYVVRVGIIGAEAKKEHDKDGVTNAKLGTVHEFGATIKHPGGTPYIVTDKGARFVKKENGKGLPITKPHTIDIPRRSFLEEPLKAKLNFKKNSTFKKATQKEAWKQIFGKGNQKKFLNYLGQYALKVIADSFEAGGSPKWQSLTSATACRKGSNLPLSDTGNLKGSISYKVIDKSK